MRPLGKRRNGPSRLGYRLERLWLTPGFRTFVRWAPVLFILTAGIFYLATSPTLRGTMEGFYTDLVHDIDGREEFRVQRIEVTGASPDVGSNVIAALDLDLPTSSLRLNVNALRERANTVSAVAASSVRIAKGGTLHVDVVERRPAVLWRANDVLEVLDREGILLSTETAREARPMLPLLVGDGARDTVREALAILTTAAPIYNRIRALERVGTRRWDVLLDNDQTILLPEQDAVTAMKIVMAHHATAQILDRDVQSVDMRIPSRPTVVLGNDAYAQMMNDRYLRQGGD